MDETNKIDDGKIYTVIETAQLLQVSEGTVRRWIRDGQLKAKRTNLRRDYRVSAAAIDQFKKEFQLD